KLLQTCALQVSHDGTSPSLSVLTPNILDAEWLDPRKPTRLIVTHPGSQRPEQTEYTDWTATSFTRRDWRGNEIANPNNAGGVNPYGILPFVPLFDRDPDDEFFLLG